MNYPLTNPQNSIWLTEKFYTNTAINNIGGYVYIKESVNFELLKKAINIAVKTNDGMRLNFKEVNNSCVQYVSDYSEFNIEIIELGSIQEIENKAKEISNIPFILEKNNLFKFVLYKLPDNSGGILFSTHHLISDSWSIGLLTREVINNYTNLLNNIDINIQLPSYLDYIKAENEYLNSNKFSKDKEYWNDIFSSVPEVASIPAYNSNLQTDINCKGNRLNFIFSENDINKIKDFCSKYNVSVYNFFMAIYSIYIGRVSSLDDFVIGTPVLNRTTHSQKNTTGMFVSTCPLRINLEHELCFNDYVKNISINTLSLFRHQKFPYQNILEELRKQDSSIPNLYNIILSYQITKTIEENSNLNYSTKWVHNGYCADELQIHLFDLNDENSINVAYDFKANKYTEEDISDLHSRISTMIAQIVENPELKLKEIEIVTPEEKNKILYEFNDTQVDYPKDKTIVDLFEEQAEKNPDKIAVVFEDQQLTYKELNEKANQLARYLIEKGAKPNNKIGIMLNRSIDLIIGLLSILKCGCTYIPLDPQYPNERINYILDNSNCFHLLTDTKNYNEIQFKYNKIDILLEHQYSNMDVKNINLHINPDYLIYLIYTSGSTGNPKGVMVTHTNILNFLFGMRNILNFDENKNFLSITTICFDIFALEIWYPLIYGLKLIVANESEQNSVELLNKLCCKENVNIIQTTPSRYKDFLLDTKNLDFLNNITEILVGGEPLPSKLVEDFKNICNAKIINLYGPTETTVWSTTKEITDSTNINIGKPISNTQCYILDKNEKLLPPYTPRKIIYWWNWCIKWIL